MTVRRLPLAQCGRWSGRKVQPMKRHLSSIAALTICLGAAIFAQSFDVRTGTWEFTMSGIQGALPMDGVPPAMRAQFEAELRKPQTYKGCVTADDLKDLNFGKLEDDDDEDCKVVSSKITRTVGDLTRQCTGDRARTETSHFEATAPTALRVNVSNRTAAGVSTMTITGKWLNARCTD